MTRTHRDLATMQGFGDISAVRWGALASGAGGLPTAAEWPAVVLALFAVGALGLVLLQVAGLHWHEAVCVAVFAPALVLFDIPLLETSSGVRLAVNAAGCAIPLLVAGFVLATRPIAPFTTLVLVTVATLLALAFSWVVPSRGVLLDYRACALGIGLCAAAVLRGSPRRAGALAFAAGAIGTTLGADLFRLPQFASPGSAVMTMGGAGLLDGVLLTSVAAAVVAASAAWLAGFVLRASGARHACSACGEGCVGAAPRGRA